VPVTHPIDPCQFKRYLLQLPGKHHARLSNTSAASNNIVKLLPRHNYHIPNHGSFCTGNRAIKITDPPPEAPESCYHFFADTLYSLFEACPRTTNENLELRLQLFPPYRLLYQRQ
jgi:hypothetical protein